MHATFVELPAFERHRETYLDDDGFRLLQAALILNPIGGEVIRGTNGLRKVRYIDPRRQKGKRGGLRVIYYYWRGGPQSWLFTIYDKDGQADLTPAQTEQLRLFLEREQSKRRGI
ncbi:toxin [Cupriavidus sp. SW-Y-13]|uniref:toxin n=1 Tax=Cupriavidus sp. SW-Y-13 TaxID=2653854 RepID=UPI001365A2AB|nr:toxin [Cupriavidus sp. SW-Y-13]MWL87407.1 toxin [Cupriavidus sp. SW-Y-13]